MVENELIVRLVECAKPLNSIYDSDNPTQILVTGWTDTTTVPKRGEICLEYYTNTDTSSANYGKICYRMKIGDGIHKYIESNPDDSLPYFPLSDDIINIIVNWVNTHLNVDEYAQAYYDNTNHKLKVYSISEKNGMIGHLADGTTPTLDVEVTFAAGTKIDLSSSDNTLTITHESTTRSDTDNDTNLSDEDSVVTGVTTDGTGHITGITTYKLPHQTSSKSIVGGSATATTDAAVTSNPYLNHLEDTTVTSSHQILGADKITVSSNASGNISIDHDDTTRNNTDNTTNLSFGDSVVTGVSSDATGHVTGTTTYKLPNNPVNDLDVTAYAQVSLDGTNKKVKISKIEEVNGKIRQPSTNGTTDITLSEGNKIDITVNGTTNTIEIKHEDVASSGGTNITPSYDSPNTLDFEGDVITGIVRDAQGHVISAKKKKLPTNPVSSTASSNKIMVAGSTNNTTTESGFIASNDTISESGSGNTTTLPTIDAVIDYVTSKLTASMVYKGTVATESALPASPETGWVYIASAQIIADGTGALPDGTYDAGDYFIWNGSVWDVIQGAVRVTNNDATIINTLTTIATVEGTEIKAKVNTGSTSTKGIVQLNDAYSSTEDTKAATGKSIKAAIDAMDVSTDKGAASIANGSITINAVQQEDGLIKDGGTTTINYEGTYDASTNKLATQSTVSDAINNLNVATDKGAASISGSIITINAIQQENGLVKDGGTTTINIDGTYDAIDNKIATQSTVTGAIEALDGNATTVDTTNSLDVIHTVSETDGIVSSTKKTLKEGTRVKITAPTTGDDAGKIVVAHKKNVVNNAEVNPTITDNTGSANIGERETEVITDMTVDDYGHVTAYTKDKSTNLIAADIKAPVTKTDDTTWNYRETGGEISIGEDIARISKLKGNTVVWNQNVKNGDFSDGDSGWSGITSVSNGIATRILTATGSTTSGPVIQSEQYTINNKYLFIATVKSNNTATRITLAPTGTTSDGATEYTYYADWTTISYIWTAVERENTKLVIRGNNALDPNTDINFSIKNVMCFDLTKMFGSDDAIKAALGVSTLEGQDLVTAATNFEKLFPNSYYPYCEGRLVSLGGYGVKWNQLAPTTTSPESPVIGLTITESGDGTRSVVGTSTNTATQDIDIVRNFGNVTLNHVYYLKMNFSNNSGTVPSSSTFGWKVSGMSTNVVYADSVILEAAQSTTAGGADIMMRISPSIAVNFTVRPILIDLTEMFGPGSEPTLEEFEAMFPDDYYEYNAGTEMNIFDVATGENKLGLVSTGDIPDESEPHAVDMGLPSGLLWADSNIDITQEDGFAESPYQYGCTMFSWGNVDGHNTPATGTTFDYNWGGVNQQEPWYDGQVYGGTPGNSLTADIVTHNVSQDAAYRNVGAPWHMPSSAEFQELFDNCDFIDANGNIITGTDKRTTVSGVLGIYLRSKINGNRLFFACSGNGNGTSWNVRGSHGNYWSASFGSARDARLLRFYSGGVYPQLSNYRYYGLAVRPVRYKKQTLDLDWIRNIEYTPDGSSTPEKLFPYGLLSAGSVYDEVGENYAIKRVGSVDLGSLSWAKDIYGQNTLFYADLTHTKGINGICQKYANNVTAIYGAEMNEDKMFSVNLNATTIYFRDDSYTTVATFKAAMSGVMLYYELATPVEIPLDEPHQMGYVVDDKGTEALLPQNSNTVITAPFAGSITYQSNFKDAVKELIANQQDYEIIHENGVKVTPTTISHAGIKVTGRDSHTKYYKLPFSAIINDISTGDNAVTIILDGNFS